MKYSIPTLLAFNQGSKWEHCDWTANIEYCKRQGSSSQRKPGLSEKTANSSTKKSAPSSSSFYPRKITTKKGRPLSHSQKYSKERPRTPVVTNDGFAQFLRKHSSPTHQRVTAGGKIVPMVHSQEGAPRSGSGIAEWPFTLATYADDVQSLMDIHSEQYRQHQEVVDAANMANDVQDPNAPIQDHGNGQMHYAVSGVEPSQIPTYFPHVAAASTRQEYDHVTGSSARTIQSLQEIEINLGFLLYEVGRKIARTLKTHPRDRDQRIVFSLARGNIHQAFDYCFEVGWTPYRSQQVNVPIQYNSVSRLNTGGAFYPRLRLLMATNFVGQNIVFVPGQRFLPITLDPTTDHHGNFLGCNTPIGPGRGPRRVNNPFGRQSAEEWVNEVPFATIQNDDSTFGRQSRSKTEEWVDDVALSTGQNDDNSFKPQREGQNVVESIVPEDMASNAAIATIQASPAVSPAENHSENVSDDLVYRSSVSLPENCTDENSLGSGDSDTRRLMRCLEEVIADDSEVSRVSLNSRCGGNLINGQFLGGLDGTCELNDSKASRAGLNAHSSGSSGNGPSLRGLDREPTQAALPKSGVCEVGGQSAGLRDL
ncbi:hypothetical protein N7495_005273 [Penicillium taxi]|uniref:uncharacterized protein n=1 Tax=Penicillium taxi TaxID=168475 RepID=UPI0025450B9C|nr:uncharacterized protein N7495_005273 [Penicillium taxi]KAJ5893582.1 hypothetical protein N7495_005273 [Penicillium taxi]